MSCSAFGGALARRASLSRNCFVLGLVLCSEQNGRGLRNFHYHPILLSACPSASVRRPSPGRLSDVSDRPTCLPFPLECPQKEHQPSLSLSRSSFFFQLTPRIRPAIFPLSPSLPFTTWAVSAAALRHGERPSAAAPSVYLARPPSSHLPAHARARPRPLTRLIGLHNLRLQRRRRRRIGTC